MAGLFLKEEGFHSRAEALSRKVRAFRLRRLTSVRIPKRSNLGLIAPNTAQLSAAPVLALGRSLARMSIGRRI